MTEMNNEERQTTPKPKKKWFKCGLCGKRVYTIKTFLLSHEKFCSKCWYGDK